MKIPVMKGEILGVKVFRGFAPLSLLSKISRADVYDQVNNPRGTQRDLSEKHAREAYAYIQGNKLGFWPEVFLNIRAKRALSFKPLKGSKHFGLIEFDPEKISKSKKIFISRVDGNHRLYFGDGGPDKKYPPIEKMVSFCLAYDLTSDQEISLFRDINNNQRRMNTSHLDNIEIRLTPEERLKREDPILFIANKLADVKTSPFHDLVYKGGQKIPGKIIPLRSLKSSLEYLFSSSRRLKSIGNVDAQFEIIKNYFLAFQKWVPEAWEKPRNYIALRGAGLWGVSFLGGEVIDLALSRNEFSSGAMFTILKSGTEWDWSNSGDFKGLSGRGGATEIKDKIVEHFDLGEGFSPKSIVLEILKKDS